MYTNDREYEVFENGCCGHTIAMDERYVETDNYHEMMRQEKKLSKKKNLQLSNWEIHGPPKMLFPGSRPNVEDIIPTQHERNWKPAKARYAAKAKIGTPMAVTQDLQRDAPQRLPETTKNAELDKKLKGPVKNNYFMER